MSRAFREATWGIISTLWSYFHHWEEPQPLPLYCKGDRMTIYISPPKKPPGPHTWWRPIQSSLSSGHFDLSRKGKYFGSVCNAIHRAQQKCRVHACRAWQSWVSGIQVMGQIPGTYSLPPSALVLTGHHVGPGVSYSKGARLWVRKPRRWALNSFMPHLLSSLSPFQPRRGLTLPLTCMITDKKHADALLMHALTHIDTRIHMHWHIHTKTDTLNQVHIHTGQHTYMLTVTD